MLTNSLISIPLHQSAILMKFLLLAITLSVLLGSFSKAQMNLAPKWAKGMTHKYLIEYNFSSETVYDEDLDDENNAGLSQILKLDTSWEFEKALANGSSELGVTIDRVRFTANGKGEAAMVKNLTIDSNEKGEREGHFENIVGPVLKAYVGPVGTVTVDAHGKMTGFSPVDEFAEKFTSMASELAGFFGKSFWIDGVKDHLTEWLVGFPEGPVAKGDTWNQKLGTQFGNGIVCVHNYELVGPVLNDGGSWIQLDITSKIKESDDPDPEIELTNREGSGVVHLDSNTHLISKFVSKQDASMKLSHQSVGMVVDMHQKTLYRVTLQTGEPAPVSSEPEGSE